jgi:hypothetical protein
LGVVIEKETPEKIAFNDLKKPTGCTLCTDIFHFRASNDQLTNIKRKTRRKLMTLVSVKDALIFSHDSSRFGWFFICLAME